MKVEEKEEEEVVVRILEFGALGIEQATVVEGVEREEGITKCFEVLPHAQHITKEKKGGEE